MKITRRSKQLKMEKKIEQLRPKLYPNVPNSCNKPKRENFYWVLINYSRPQIN